MAYRIKAIPMTLSHIEGHSLPQAFLSDVIRRTAMQQLARFQLI